MTRIEIIKDQLIRVRVYTNQRIDAFEPSDWFRMPPQGITHLAWQVAHLAFAEYRLGLDRIRGIQPEDEQLIPAAFLEKFGRSSEPDPDPKRNPTPAEIRGVFDRVHQEVLKVLHTLPDEELDKPTTKPHPMFETKFGSLIYCPKHEMLHAGQIGLLRRLLGYKPVW